MKRNTTNDPESLIKKYVRTILFVLCGLFLLSMTRSGYRIYSSRSQVGDAQEKLESLKVENEKLKKDLENAVSASFKERQVRDKLQLAKEGEIVLVLPDTEVLRQLAPARESKVEVLPDPNWKKWMNLFM